MNTRPASQPLRGDSPQADEVATLRARVAELEKENWNLKAKGDKVASQGRQLASLRKTVQAQALDIEVLRKVKADLRRLLGSSRAQQDQLRAKRDKAQRDLRDSERECRSLRTKNTQLADLVKDQRRALLNAGITVARSASTAAAKKADAAPPPARDAMDDFVPAGPKSEDLWLRAIVRAFAPKNHPHADSDRRGMAPRRRLRTTLAGSSLAGAGE